MDPLEGPIFVWERQTGLKKPAGCKLGVLWTVTPHSGPSLMSNKVAVIQKPPVLLNKQATIDRALGSIEEAVGKGAELLVFPEAYVPGYPTWGWRLRPGGDMALAGEIHARLRQEAVDLARGDLQALQDAAKKHSVCVVIGVSELDSQFSGTTLFNTVVVIGPEGEILNRHRKLCPRILNG